MKYLVVVAGREQDAWRWHLARGYWSTETVLSREDASALGVDAEGDLLSLTEEEFDRAKDILGEPIAEVCHGKVYAPTVGSPEGLGEAPIILLEKK